MSQKRDDLAVEDPRARPDGTCSDSARISRASDDTGPRFAEAL
jgi:hypothetical protein